MMKKELIKAMHFHMFDLNVNVTTQTTEGQSLSVEMKTFYDKTLIRLAEVKLIHDQFGQKRNIPKNGGKTIEFRQFPALPKALTPLTEGVTPDGRKLNATSITATVSQYGDYVATSDMLQLTAIDNIAKETLTLIASQAGRTLDTITREVLCGGTNVRYVNSKTSRDNIASTDVLTVKDIKKAVRDLKTKNAETINGCYVALIHPDAVYDIWNDDEWIAASRYAGSEQLFKGEIGKIFGVRFVESTEAKIWSHEYTPSGGSKTVTPVYGTIVLGANAFGTTTVEGGGLETIVKQLGSGGTADPLNQRATVGWKAVKTAVRLVEEYMVRIEHSATLSSSAN